MNVEDIARICHSVNKAYCESIGDASQVDWDLAPSHVKKSVIDGVQFIINNPNAGPDASHNNWLKFKEAEGGWKYAPVKNLEKKEHNCFLPYNELPKEQHLKDILFTTIVKSLIPHLNTNNTIKADSPNPITSSTSGIIHSFDEDGKRHADLSGLKRDPL